MLSSARKARTSRTSWSRRAFTRASGSRAPLPTGLSRRCTLHTRFVKCIDILGSEIFADATCKTIHWCWHEIPISKYYARILKKKLIEHAAAYWELFKSNCAKSPAPIQFLLHSCRQRRWSWLHVFHCRHISILSIILVIFKHFYLIIELPDFACKYTYFPSVLGPLPSQDGKTKPRL